MEIKAVIESITKIKTGAVIVPVFEEKELSGDLASIDKALNGAVAMLIGQGEIKGKPGEVTVIHSLGKIPADRVAVVGLGKRADFALDKIRSAIAEACRVLQKKGVDSVATPPLGAGTAEVSLERSGIAITEGALLGTYTFCKHITTEKEGEIKRLQILAGDKSSVEEIANGICRGRIQSEAAILARDMVNEPANYMTPSKMAEIATGLARSHGLEITVLEREQVWEMGMGAFLGVAQGSQQPPKFIIMKYKGRNSDEVDLAIVGKGITFDSGGIDLKPAEKMEDMKGDMAGGAAAITALSAISQFKPKINVVAITAATENMPDGGALKPGDILTAMSGKTIEIMSTDAEGRLTLADAIAYAKKIGAKAIVDAATLTGACRVALGDIYTGAFSNNQELLNKVIAAGDEAGELTWQLPLHELFREQNKSDVADIKNVGGRYAGAITAAQFLGEFVGDTPWVHLDIAGTSMAEKERAYLSKGATGVPVRTLINLILALAE